MPRLLPKRFRPDTINEFLASARSRSKEAWVLLESGNRTAAIYLWGYVGEMILKAAWFRLIGYAVDQRIAISDLHQAQAQGKVLGMSWKGNLHNLQAWAELIVEQRKAVGPAYYSAHTSGAVLQHASTIQARWREVIRYKANTAYLHEARSVAESALWLLIHADQIRTPQESIYFGEKIHATPCPLAAAKRRQVPGLGRPPRGRTALA